MGKIVLDEPLATQIRREAEAQGMDVEAFVEAAIKHYRFKMQKEKIDVEAQWWRTQLEDVRKRYSGEFVAVHHQEVVDHDRDEEALQKRIRAKFGKTTIYITPAAGRRELRIVSTRLSRTL